MAIGTPISNSMTELYTNMRYLQYGTLQKLGLGHFDSWASSFGETQTAIELAPEGDGLPRENKVCKVLQFTGAHRAVQGERGHTDAGYA